MLDEAEKLLKEHIQTGEKICVAVSGGADSMCLLSLVLNQKFINNSDITAVNINHKIRGKKSDEESEFVKQFCLKNNVNFMPVVIDVPAYRAAERRSIETVAREKRYEVFDRLINTGAVSKVLTAHHALDNAETVLMHMFRGSGLNGLKGMEILRDNRYLRPLLTTAKAEIEQYLTAHKIKHIIDDSNADNKYSRNFIRNEILPLIESRYSGAVGAINNLSGEVKDTALILDGLLNLELIKKTDEKTVKININAFKNPRLSGRYVLSALGQIGIKFDIERKNIFDIISLKEAFNGSQKNIKKYLTAVKEYDFITIYKTDNETKLNEPANSIEFDLSQKETIFCGKVISVKGLSGFKKITQDNNQNYNKTLFFDGDKIPEGAVIRHRRDGDNFRKFGGGTKKLKEYLIDKKVPKRLRDSLPLICYENNVLIIIGLEISESVKIDETEKLSNNHFAIEVHNSNE